MPVGFVIWWSKDANWPGVPGFSASGRLNGGYQK